MRRGLVVAQQIDIRREVQRDPLRHGISVLGDLNRRGQHFIHFLFAEPVEQLLPSIDGAGNGDRLDPAHRHIAQALLAQPLDRLRGGRPAAGVQAIIFSALRVVHDREQIAADAVPHRRHHGHHGVRRNRRVHRVAAALQNRGARFRCQRRFRGHNPGLRDHHRASLTAILRHGVLPIHPQCEKSRNQGQHEVYLVFSHG